MKTLKKGIALLLALMMVLSLGAFSAFADDPGEEGAADAVPTVIIEVTAPSEESSESSSDETGGSSSDETSGSSSEDTSGSSSDETSDPAPVEADTVMDVVEEIHDAIDNAADGSTVTITVGDGEGTLTNDGEGVLEAWAQEKKNPTTEIIKARRALGDDPEELFDQYYGGDPNAQYEYWKNNKIKSIANWNAASEEKLENSEAFANGKIDGYLVGQNILLVPNDGTVAVTTIGTLESDGRFNNTIAGTTGSNGTLIINGGTYVGDTADEKGSYVINVAGGTVEVKEGNFSGAILVTGTIIRDSDNSTILSGGTLKIDGGTFTDYTIQNDRAQQWADSANTLIKGYTGSDGTVLISGGNFDAIDTIKESYLVVDPETGVDTILVRGYNSDNDETFTAINRGDAARAGYTLEQSSEGIWYYYALIPVVNEQTGETTEVLVPVYFDDSSSDDDDDDDTAPATPAAPAEPETIEIEEEATPLSALPEGFEEAITVTIGDEEVPLSEVPLTFADVPASGWEHDAIAYVTATGLMQGTDSEGKGFEPQADSTRGMVSVILMRLAGGEATATNTYSDIAEGTYYAEAAAWATEFGVYEGYTDGSFRGDDTITVEQLVSVMYRYAGISGYDTSARADLSAYTDAADISEYAAEAMAWAVSVGLIQGDGDLLNPTSAASRAQLAMILMRFSEMTK